MHGWILSIEPRVQGNILVDIFQSFWRRKLYCVRFILSISVTSTEVSRGEKHGGVDLCRSLLYPADYTRNICHTVRRIQHCLTVSSKKKKKKVLQSSSDWNWIHSFNLQRLKRYVFHAKQSVIVNLADTVWNNQIFCFWAVFLFWALVHMTCLCVVN